MPSGGDAGWELDDEPTDTGPTLAESHDTCRLVGATAPWREFK